MKYCIVSGSHRKASQSSRVGQYISKLIGGSDKKSSVYSLDLAENPLPLWDESFWSGAESWQNVWSPVAKHLQETEAFVIIAPEWSGMVPAGLKNFFLLASAKELGHKPALIVAISSSRGGTYPVAELRMSSYKNTRITYIPEHVIIRDVASMLVDKEPSSEEDSYIRNRLQYSINLLHEYGKAMNQIRGSGVLDYKTYPNGM